MIVMGAAILGLMVGSFLNVVIHRVPRGISIVWPRSSCPGCRKAIPWFDNIPVVSFLLLRARCRGCGRHIPYKYPLVEVATGVLFALAATTTSDPVRLTAVLTWISLLIAVTVIDLEHQIIPDVITFPGIALGLLARALSGQSLLEGLTGLVVGGGTLLVTAWVYRRVTGVDGMGMGDVKLMAMVGAFLGWSNALSVIFLASTVGALIGIALLTLHRAGRRTALPFGTFLAPVSVFVLLMGGAAGLLSGRWPW